MKTILLLCGLTAGGLFYSLRSAPPDYGTLEGKWKIVSPPKDWKIAPGTNINVTGDEIQIRLGPVKGSTLHYSADYPSGNIDAQKGHEKPRLGKFALSGDTVTIAVGEPGSARPESTSASSGVQKWVLRRTAGQ